MPDMQAQIDALREAFSADLRKPFVLKPSFPYGSPAAPLNRSPPLGSTHFQQNSIEQNLGQQRIQQPHVSYTSHPLTPPISVGGLDTKSDSPGVQSLAMMANGQRANQQPMVSGASMTDPPAWNPARIFE